MQIPRFPAPDAPASSSLSGARDGLTGLQPVDTTCEQLLATIERELAHLVQLVDLLRELADDPLVVQEPPPSACPVRQPRVLIVEEDADAVATWTSLLRSAGVETATICGGSEAVEAAQQIVPRIVLLDIDLPHVNRYEIARLRAQERLKGAQFVAVTGWGADGEPTRPNAAGFDFYLTKPLSTRQWHELFERLRALGDART